MNKTSIYKNVLFLIGNEEKSNFFNILYLSIISVVIVFLRLSLLLEKLYKAIQKKKFLHILPL